MRRVVILADESAHWKIAGLRQLERVALEASSCGPIMLSICWDPALPPDRQFTWRHPKLTGLQIESALPAEADLLLSTHLLLARGALYDWPGGGPPNRPFAELAQEVRAASLPNEAAVWLEDASQLGRAEARFLRATGKSQDGLVSRFLNRPISRAISRLLLRTSITPSGWTLLIFILPLLGAGLFLRGDYASIVAGLLLFQLYSILDGCDGEIARAKYLESERGRRLDMWCDTIGNLLMVLALAYGLGRIAEGLVVAGLIATNEFLLAAPQRISESTGTGEMGGALYPRHEKLMDSGLLIFGQGFASWLIQLTKRDVALLAFLLLALAGRPGWILHLLGGVAAVSSLLALRSRFR